MSYFLFNWFKWKSDYKFFLVAKPTINKLNGVNSSPTYVFPLNEANHDGASGSGIKNLYQEDNVNSGGSGSQAQALPNNDENDN